MAQGERMDGYVKIGDDIIGEDAPPYIIAEAGINHDGDVEKAVEMVHKAKECGANAVKFQWFRADRLMVKDGRLLVKLGYRPRSGAYEIFRKTELSEEAHVRLIEESREAGITYLCTPFHPEAVENLDARGVEAFKIASSDLTHHPLLRIVARKGKPVLLSTGMSDEKEIANAIQCLRKEGNEQVILLHCISQYPADFSNLNLRFIEQLKKRFKRPVGFSDHSKGITASCAAYMLGALVIEKHFTLDRASPGPDHPFSLLPGELRELRERLSEIRLSLGSTRERILNDEEKEARIHSRRSIVALRDLPSGTVLTPAVLDFKRPGVGISPRHYDRILGFSLKVDVEKDQPLRWQDLSAPSEEMEV